MCVEEDRRIGRGEECEEIGRDSRMIGCRQRGDLRLFCSSRPMMHSHHSSCTIERFMNESEGCRKTAFAIFEVNEYFGVNNPRGYAVVTCVICIFWFHDICSSFDHCVRKYSAYSFSYCTFRKNSSSPQSMHTPLSVEHISPTVVGRE